ncbi:helix-turn-helix domain-containing protein [Salmonella enterica]|nr:helix-turn-helix domain-containing protein [Salmonella enterica]ECW0264954.1 helix-turn-helix domain-containing protein [Salmonella enterica subsp. diarizonae]EBD5983677.1 helix-turn-helix domain-containing protein [Salmonella enterica]EBI4324801.1 helix-turn-helix domain-containing protein [Salmonella enterica]ECO4385967.1 helix-turn-helix domain-containing protein [Salmonella enterica]
MRLKDLPIEVQISFKTNLEGLCVSLFGDESSITTPTSLQPGDTLTIGARIRQLRKERMLTQAELAAATDVTTQAISLWENDNTTMSVDKLIPLANALKCDPMWLLTGQSSNANQATPAPINIMKGVDMANIGVRIESRRHELEMGAVELAEKIDTSRAMIREWETGKAIPHSGYYDKLAKALNTSVTWLMTGRDITGECKNQHDKNIPSPALTNL